MSMKMRRHRQSGFTLIEVMIVLLLMSIIMGAVFTQINTAQQRAGAEQQKLDLVQEAREFMDQMTRNLRAAGYPNLRNFASAQTSGNNDPALAVGLVKIDVGDLWFEGDVNGTGTVSSVRYHYTATGPNCPCVQRSEVDKTSGLTPLTQTTNYQIEVQNVLNGTTTAPIFYAYKLDGTQVTLPVDISSDPNTIADIAAVKAVLTVQSKYVDQKTGVRPIVTLVTTVMLNNCNNAASGRVMSCQ